MRFTYPENRKELAFYGPYVFDANGNKVAQALDGGIASHVMEGDFADVLIRRLSFICDALNAAGEGWI